MSQTGAYLYCLALPGAAAGMQLPGVDGRAEIETLERQGLAAVFSTVSVGEFSASEAGPDISAPAWLVPRALRHEQVVEAVMARSPVLPARFGTIFTSHLALEELLTERRDEIAQFLRGVSGKEEWSVKVFLDMDRVGAWLLAWDPILAERRRQLSSAPGARYFQEKRLRGDVQNQVKQRGQSVAEQVGEQLRSLDGDIRPLKLQGPDEAGRQMVFHSAVLLSREAVATLRGQLEAIQAEVDGQGVVLESSGPWPPYNFCPTLGNTTDGLPGVRDCP
jgi:hypothetical protein